MTDDEDSIDRVRLDKWLWAARFFKTRSLARAAIEGGKVHYQDRRVKPSQIVSVDHKVTIRQGVDERTVTVLALSTHRGGAPAAALLYQEAADSVRKREEGQLARKLMASHAPVQGRPDKKQRRQIVQFKTRLE